MKDFLQELEGEGKFDENVQGLLYFVPYIIQYDLEEEIEIPLEEIRVQLGVPGSAKLGDSYTVKDESYIPPDGKIKTSRLEKNSGSGWKTVPGWNGISVKENADTEGKIEYRLTVTLEDGRKGSDTQFITVFDGVKVEGEAVLSLPSVTYEGHSVIAEDYSTFTVNGIDYGAVRAYEEKVASNQFSILENGPTIRRVSGSKTKATATFPSKGTYNVRLKVTPKNGSVLMDTKSIEVLKTPTVMATLTGVQKQNRKQELHIRVATNPQSPLRELWVELEDLDSGEKVRLTHSGDGNSNELSNSDEIKTRAIKLRESDAYFTDLSLEFLTKNPQIKYYQYTIYAKDSRGMNDKISEEFIVVPDAPPQADIEMDNTFLREQGSDQAIVSVKDSSETDGDQLERRWSVVLTPDGEGGFDGNAAAALSDMSGYEDLSFGSGQSVAFHKTGVGKFQIGLTVKDVWTEETLEEYVTEADRLSDSTAKVAEVQNVAPVVTLKALKGRTADILLLAGSEEDERKLKESVNSMREVLLQYAIDPKITIERIAPEISDLESGTNQKLVKTFQANPAQGYQSRWSFLNTENYLVDDTSVYQAEATWKGWDSGFQPELPYRIRAYDIKTGKQKWVYTISDTAASGRMAQDDGSKYLFYTRSGKTVIIDKATGSRLAMLNMEVGKNTVATDRHLYTFKMDGIHRVALSNGQTEHIYKGYIGGDVRRIGGKVHFFTQDGAVLYRGIFDQNTEKVTYQRLSGSEHDQSDTSYTAVHIDSAGGMVIRGTAPDGGSNGKVNLVVHHVDGQNKHVERLLFSNVYSYEAIITPVLDEGGVCTRLLYTTKSGSSSRGYTTYVHLRDSGGWIETSEKNSHGYPSDPANVLFARQFGNSVYAATGAYWDWIYGETYSNGPRHGLPQRTTITSFDLGRRGGGRIALANGADITDTEEYSLSSDTAVVVKSTDNCQHGGEDRITTLVWQQNADAVLARNINKYFASESDLKVMAVFDSANRAGKSSVIEAAKLLGKQNVDFYYSTGLSYNDAYGIRLAQQTNGMVISDPENFVRRVAEAMLEEKTEGGNTLLMETAREGTGLSRSFAMEPGARYYFEYDVKSEAADVKNLLRLEPNIYKALKSGLLPDRYVVTESFYENFNDSQTERYFNLRPDRVKQGKYYGADLKMDVGRGDRAYKDVGHVSFHVPAGKKAILSFDYDASVVPHGVWEGSTIDIGTGKLTGKTADGQKEIKVLESERWRAFVNGSKEGHYTHHKFLPEGLNTITLTSWTVDQNKLNAHTAIDNLQVAFLEKDDGSFTNDVRLEGVAEVSLGNGWKRVSGYFQAPHQTVAYQRQKASYYNGPFKDSPHGSISVKDVRNKTAKFTIPSGKTALYLGVDTVSWSLSKKNTQFIWRDYTWYNRVTSSYGKDTPDTIPDTYRLQLHNLTGSQSIDTTAPYSGGSGDFRAYEAIIIDQVNRCTNDFRYFYDDQQLFIENERYTGNMEVQLAPSQPGKYQLQNLRLFTVQNGEKVYIAHERFDSMEDVNRWKSADEVKTAIIRDNLAEDDIDSSLVYRKGELVAYGISYYDYEADPSKKSYWKYTHRPFNDGEHPDAAVIVNDANEVVKLTGKILDKPIDRFYIDGKYIVEHWQEDDTTRGKTPGGNPGYDKLSNVETITFYVQGSGEAPWITGIETDPKDVKESDGFTIKVGVDDKEKDVLSLVTETYLDSKLIHTHKKDDIKADETGKYPLITTDAAVSSARAGKYEIVCTVRDDSGTGIDSKRFTVVSEGKVTGWVNHTDQWDANRKKYNLARFDDEVNYPVSFSAYSKEAAPRKRGTNVFWSGETFELEAALAGRPNQVTVEILNHPDYRTTLYNTGNKNAADETIYAGTLWNKSMINKWGRTEPEKLTFRFTARYPKDVEKTHNVDVIVDSQTDYWLLHRLW